MPTPDQLREEFEKTFADTNYRGAITRDAMSDFWLAKIEEVKKEVVEGENTRIGKLVANALGGETLSGMSVFKLSQIFHPHSKDETASDINVTAKVEIELQHCKTCNQMTNHQNGLCFKHSLFDEK